MTVPQGRELLYIGSISALILAVAFSVLWPRRLENGVPKNGRLLKFLGALGGVALLFLALSADRKTQEQTNTTIAAYQEHTRDLEKNETELAFKMEALQTENKDLKDLVSQTSAEKKRAAEESRRLYASLEEAVRTVAVMIPGTTKGTTTLQIKDAVLFKVDQWQLECESKEKLSRLIGFLTYQIRAYPDSHIKITGHTDITGSDSHDDMLSVNRAREVKAYLISAGIPAGILEDAGLGKRQPAGFTEPQTEDIVRKANQTEEERQKNRRVEIVISVSTST